MGIDAPMDLADDINWLDDYTEDKFRNLNGRGGGPPLFRGTEVVEFPVDQNTLTKRYTEEAIKWYLMSAKQGHTLAQSNLGGIYGNGRGVAQDYVQAHMWFNLAVMEGHENAVRSRDMAEKRMTPEEIEQARALAQDWMRKHQRGL